MRARILDANPRQLNPARRHLCRSDPCVVRPDNQTLEHANESEPTIDSRTLEPEAHRELYRETQAGQQVRTQEGVARTVVSSQKSMYFGHDLRSITAVVSDGC